MNFVFIENRERPLHDKWFEVSGSQNCIAKRSIAKAGGTVPFWSFLAGLKKLIFRSKKFSHQKVRLKIALQTSGCIGNEIERV